MFGENEYLERIPSIAIIYYPLIKLGWTCAVEKRGTGNATEGQLALHTLEVLV